MSTAPAGLDSAPVSTSVLSAAGSASYWSTWPFWTAIILLGAFIQALSFVPALRRLRLRPWLVAAGGALVLFAAQQEHDQQLLVCQLAIWVWLWRGVIRSRP